jgi:hypothetical protein
LYGSEQLDGFQKSLQEMELRYLAEVNKDVCVCEFYFTL